MTHTCANEWCRTSFEVTEEDSAFYDKASPVFGGKKEDIPHPTRCPDCRMQRRLAFRNERNLYRRTCDLSGREIVSMYAPGKHCTVYQSDEWFTDKWNALDYGRDVDFGRPFFAQLAELRREVPHSALHTTPDAEAYNSVYINFAGHSENCYMTFDSDYNRDSCYANVLKHSRSCIDCSFVHDSELCYECVDCYGCYNLRFSEDCTNCSDGAFLKNCTGCRNCFFCANLTQKEYHIFNKPYAKEDYERTVAELRLGTWSGLQKVWEDFPAFALRFPRKYRHAINAESATGDYLKNVQRCHHCFDIADAQDLRYCDTLYKAKDCMDVSSFGENIQLVYESGTAGIECYNLLFCFGCVISCSDLICCDECRHASHCFGCVSLKGEYCILNKQYTKEEYEALVPRIIAHMRETGEWGEYFPPAASLFGYNETVAQEYFPLTKEEALARGFLWFDDKEKASYGDEPAYDVPDDIADVSDDVTHHTLRCDATGRPYKVTPQELAFYRSMGLPLPRLHPDERHARRMARRNPRTLWDRTCANCSKAIRTSYASDRPETVCCEECYLKEVY